MAVVELFDRLDDLQMALSQNADRWLLSGGGEGAASVVAERTNLYRELGTIEQEIRRRPAWDRFPDNT